MSAPFIVCNEIVVTIQDVQNGITPVEVDVKVPGPDCGVHKFDADNVLNGALKIKAHHKSGYWKLAQYVPLPLASQYAVLL